MIGVGLLLMALAVVYALGAMVVGVGSDMVYGATRDPRYNAGAAVHTTGQHFVIAMVIGAVGLLLVCVGWMVL
jgi:hypothetical protein